MAVISTIFFFGKHENWLVVFTPTPVWSLDGCHALAVHIIASMTYLAHLIYAVITLLLVLVVMIIPSA